MSRKRRSYEAGHKPKFLVIIDDTPECDRAVYYASRRAARTSGGVIMLRVIETQDSAQQWLGVADIMKAEAQEAADAVLDALRRTRRGHHRHRRGARHPRRRCPRRKSSD